MIYELRAYDLLPGKGPAYLDLFRQDGVQYVTRHLPMGGYWLTDSGALNRLYHLWIYESLEERMAARVGLAADEDWNNRFVPKGFPLIVTQKNWLMALEEGSTALEDAVAARKTVHAGQSAESPLFSDKYLSLTTGAPAQTQGKIARWRVISGADIGMVFTLFGHDGTDPMDSAQGADRHELLRAITCSPLK